MCLAIPGKVLEIVAEAPLRTGRVDFGGAVQTVNLAAVPAAAVGDYVIAHAGCAVDILPESDALQILAYLEQLYDPVDPGAGGLSL